MSNFRDGANMGKKKANALNNLDTSKPFMMAAHRTLRPDENPIDIFKEFIKSGAGGTIQFSDGKNTHERTRHVSIYAGGKKIAGTNYPHHENCINHENNRKKKE